MYTDWAEWLYAYKAKAKVKGNHCFSQIGLTSPWDHTLITSAKLHSNATKLIIIHLNGPKQIIWEDTSTSASRHLKFKLKHSTAKPTAEFKLIALANLDESQQLSLHISTVNGPAIHSTQFESKYKYLEDNQPTDLAKQLFKFVLTTSTWIDN